FTQLCLVFGCESAPVSISCWMTYVTRALSFGERNWRRYQKMERSPRLRDQANTALRLVDTDPPAMEQCVFSTAEGEEC
ncbi:hypothetical protein STEG23_006274, partial [Scotinomys teguina]